MPRALSLWRQGSVRGVPARLHSTCKDRMTSASLPSSCVEPEGRMTFTVRAPAAPGATVGVVDHRTAGGLLMRLYYPTSKTQPDAYLTRPVRSS
jgi:hypothetical protein